MTLQYNKYYTKHNFSSFVSNRHCLKVYLNNHICRTHYPIWWLLKLNNFLQTNPYRGVYSVVWWCQDVKTYVVPVFAMASHNYRHNFVRWINKFQIMNNLKQQISRGIWQSEMTNYFLNLIILDEIRSEDPANRVHVSLHQLNHRLL